MILNINVQDRKRAIVIGGIDGRRLTHRLSLKEVERRRDFVCGKVIEMLTMSGGILTEELAREWAKAKPGVYFRRGRIRVNGINAVVEPMLAWRPDLFEDFRKDFDLFWTFNVRLRAVQRCMRLTRQLLGSTIFSDRIIRPTFTFYLSFYSRMFFNKGLEELKPNKVKVIRNLIPKVKMPGVFSKFWKMAPGRILRLNLKELWSIQTTVFGGLFQSSYNSPKTYDNLISAFPFLGYSIFGEKRLTRRQISSLRGRKELMYRIVLWDLLFNVPIIRKELQLSPSSRFNIELSLYGFVAFNNFAVISKKDEQICKIKFVRPSVITTGDGLPVYKDRYLNPGKMVVPFMNVDMFASVLKRKIRQVRNKDIGFNVPLI